MKKFLKYFLVIWLLLLSCYKINLVANALTNQGITTAESTVERITESSIKQTLADKFLACFTAEERLAYADDISTATSDALTGLYCRCGKPPISGTDILAENSEQPDFDTAVEGRAKIYAKNTLEDRISTLNKEIEQLNGAVMGTPAGAAFAALKAERDALRNGVQSYYDNISVNKNVDCSTVRKGFLPEDKGLSINSYNSSQNNSSTRDGFATTDTSGNKTFITPTDVFVSDGQSFSDSKEELKTKCLAACKQKGGTNSDCNKMCTISRCGCRDSDNNGTIEATCEAGQFGPECLGIGSCNINMCDDPTLLKSLGSGTALNTLVGKYYKTSTTGQSQGTTDSDDIRVSGINTSKSCITADSCLINVTSKTDESVLVAYLKYIPFADGQGTSLVNSLMRTAGTIEVKAGVPYPIHLNLSEANVIQIDGISTECLSCMGDMMLANLLTTGCKKAGETNPHAECRVFYDCGQPQGNFGCWNFNFCGINQCNDYLPVNGNKLQSADCRALTNGQRWKCDAITKTCETVNSSGIDTYSTKSECLSSLECGGGGTAIERNTYYCCDKESGSCSECTEGSPRYVSSAQCNNDCSKTTCPAGQTKCGSNCCRDIDQACENYTTCRNMFTCEGICCPNGCLGDTATGLCGGTSVSCCATGCK